MEIPDCLARAGAYFLKGIGGDVRTAEGLVFITRAAGRSNIASFMLGTAYFEGRYGLVKNDAHARYWLNKMDPENTSSQKNKYERAREMLRQLG